MADRLRECPFCGQSEYHKMKDYPMYTMQHKKGCFLYTPDRIAGVYRFEQKSKELKQWNTRTTDPLLEEMARALDFIAREAESYQVRTGGKVSWLNMAESALQKYRERTK